MTKFHKGIAPLILVLLVALGLAGGTAGGYAMREPIKKAISGTTTAEEITKAIDNFKLGQSKFELEGVATSVDATNSILTVMIKSSTASIATLRLSDAPIEVTATTAISSGTLASLKITDIPIDSQVHVAGTTIDGKLTATKVIVQKDEAATNKGENFIVGGTVSSVSGADITINVKTANNKAKDKKGAELVVKTDSNTIIQKAQATIVVGDIAVGDEVQVMGVIADSTYLASKIEVKVKEKAGELELEEEKNTNQNQGNSDKNKETETETNSNSNSSTPSTSNGNSANSNAGGNSTKK